MLKKLLIGVVLALITVYPNSHDSPVVRIIGLGNAAEPGYAPQVSNKRGVKVTVTLQRNPGEAKTWDFQVILETHIQDLSDDLAKSAVLIADGKQFMPLGWEGAQPGGHHRKGLLRFKAIVPKPREVELQVRLAGDTDPRSFKWLLK